MSPKGPAIAANWRQGFKTLLIAQLGHNNAENILRPSVGYLPLPALVRHNGTGGNCAFEAACRTCLGRGLRRIRSLGQTASPLGQRTARAGHVSCVQHERWRQLCRRLPMEGVGPLRTQHWKPLFALWILFLAPGVQPARHKGKSDLFILHKIRPNRRRKGIRPLCRAVSLCFEKVDRSLAAYQLQAGCHNLTGVAFKRLPSRRASACPSARGVWLRRRG